MMIAILISAALVGQTGSFDTGARMRHEANKMIMGMQNVPYDVADVLNGSNYSVEQATRIAAQRRQQRESELRRQLVDLSKINHERTKMLVKNWATLNEAYDKIITGKIVVPSDKIEATRGMMRQTLDSTLAYEKNKSIPRNVRTAARAHIKKTEAALAVLEKDAPAQKDTP